MILSNFLCLNLEGRKLDKKLFEVDKNDMYFNIYWSQCCVVIFINRYNNRILTMQRQLFLISNGINRFVDLRT
jgi:hypothetical protein